jgi:hypothetical protein
MRLIFAAMLAVIAPLAAAGVHAKPAQTAQPVQSGDQRLILVTLDGTRWQDVFRGPDPVLVTDKRFTHPDLQEHVVQSWVEGDNPGADLMPFLHRMGASGGVLTGNRDTAECMNVANPMWFSYPGYNEIFTGRADPEITSNDKEYNRNVTFFEWLQRRPAFAGKVLAFGNWDAFAYIINDKRSGVSVNPGLGGRNLTETLTMRLALDAWRTQKPRVLYVGLGDTDELAHIGDYAGYLAAMNRDDDFIAELWRMAQADPATRGKTTLIVTTDHGRGAGAGAAWTEHGSAASVALDPEGFTIPDKAGFPGSEQIWLAAIGPAVEAAWPEIEFFGSGKCLSQSQIAASALTALGEDWRAFDAKAGEPLPFFVRK